jgi:hypothetical protein
MPMLRPALVSRAITAVPQPASRRIILSPLNPATLATARPRGSRRHSRTPMSHPALAPPVTTVVRQQARAAVTSLRPVAAMRVTALPRGGLRWSIRIPARSIAHTTAASSVATATHPTAKPPPGGSRPTNQAVAVAMPGTSSPTLTRKWIRQRFSTPYPNYATAAVAATCTPIPRSRRSRKHVPVSTVLLTGDSDRCQSL